MKLLDKMQQAESKGDKQEQTADCSGFPVEKTLAQVKRPNVLKFVFSVTSQANMWRGQTAVRR